MYDLIVLGGGPAGYNCAGYAARAGLSVALVERDRLGGTCLNAGCIPTKSLLHAARLHRATPGRSLDHAAAIAQKEAVVKTLVEGVAAGLERAGVDIYRAEGEIQSAAGGFTVRAGDQTLSGRHLIVATGSTPALPPIPGVREGLADGSVLTSNEILSLSEVPGELVIVGGGVIGFEMAAYFLEAGSRVTVIEMTDKILGPGDREISLLLQKQMEARGMEIHLSAAVTGIAGNEISFTRRGEAKRARFDRALLCVGRRPNTDIKGLERTGAQIERGALVVDERLRTTAANMYAVGDVNGKVMLAHVGYREGEVAVNDILGRADDMRYDAVCSVVYTQPEAAFVGLSEEQARAAGLDYAVKKVSVNFSGRHVVENGMSTGVCKLLIDNKKQVLVGAAVLSAYASEYIYALALMIQNKIPLASIRRTVFPHPTVCEIIREALMK